MSHRTPSADVHRSRASPGPAHSGGAAQDTSRTTRSSPAARGWSRRSVLAGVGTATTVLAAGCLTGDEPEGPPPEPVSLGESQQCDYCGMVIEAHPGTNAQIFYRDDRPEDRDGPARFCSLHCAHNFHAERDRLGWELVVRYATDYSVVDYDFDVENDIRYISSAVDAETFADVEALSFVTDTGIEGAMGPEHVPFSDPAEADAFAEELDGRVLDWATLETDVLAG